MNKTVDMLEELDNQLPLVLVSVGTDMHPFERLIDWVQAWLSTPAAQGVQVVVQHGSSRAPTGCLAVELLPLDTLLELMRRATVVVLQGGPGGILDARSCGKLPLVLARHHSLGEHVDNHQVAFTSRLARDGYIQLAHDEQHFSELLNQAVTAPERVRIAVDEDAPPAPAPERIEQEVTSLLARKPPRHWRRRVSGKRGS